LSIMPSKILRVVLILAVILFPTAGNTVSLLRDAETENTIRRFGAPLFTLAGQAPGAIRVYIVRDSSLNAFVAGGRNIFLNTGLLLATQTPNQLIGVLAHETGHISGGHLVRSQEALRNASAYTILSFVLGAAAAVAGQGGAGQAIIAGGAHLTQRSFLHYSRIQEASADQAAMSFLDRSGQSSRGLSEFFKLLGDQEALLTANQDPYIRTHPLSRDRIEAIKAHNATSPQADEKDTPENIEAHGRMQAKLFGFLETPEQTYRRYPAAETSLIARYAHVFANYRQRKFDDAITILDELLKERPGDPYFLETRGQMYLESGRAALSLASYEAAVAALPGEALLQIALGQALVSTEDAANLPKAIDILRNATELTPLEPTGWRWRAQAHGRLGEIGLASLSTAESYFLRGRVHDALLQARRAEAKLAVGSVGHLRAQDLVQAAEDRIATDARRKN
jgi:predicted Zn-dependent protease